MRSKKPSKVELTRRRDFQNASPHRLSLLPPLPSSDLLGAWLDRSGRSTAFRRLRFKFVIEAIVVSDKREFRVRGVQVVCSPEPVCYQRQVDNRAQWSSR